MISFTTVHYVCSESWVAIWKSCPLKLAFSKYSKLQLGHKYNRLKLKQMRNYIGEKLQGYNLSTRACKDLISQSENPEHSDGVEITAGGCFRTEFPGCFQGTRSAANRGRCCAREPKSPFTTSGQLGAYLWHLAFKERFPIVSLREERETTSMGTSLHIDRRKKSQKREARRLSYIEEGSILLTYL